MQYESLRMFIFFEKLIELVNEEEWNIGFFLPTPVTWIFLHLFKNDFQACGYDGENVTWNSNSCAFSICHRPCNRREYFCDWFGNRMQFTMSSLNYISLFHDSKIVRHVEFCECRGEMNQNANRRRLYPMESKTKYPPAKSRPTCFSLEICDAISSLTSACLTDSEKSTTVNRKEILHQFIKFLELFAVYWADSEPFA